MEMHKIKLNTGFIQLLHDHHDYSKENPVFITSATFEEASIFESDSEVEKNVIEYLEVGDIDFRIEVLDEDGTPNPELTAHNYINKKIFCEKERKQALKEKDRQEAIKTNKMIKDWLPKKYNLIINIKDGREIGLNNADPSKRNYAHLYIPSKNNCYFYEDNNKRSYDELKLLIDSVMEKYEMKEDKKDSKITTCEK